MLNLLEMAGNCGVVAGKFAGISDEDGEVRAPRAASSD
jgi:hypothetical protein